MTEEHREQMKLYMREYMKNYVNIPVPKSIKEELKQIKNLLGAGWNETFIYLVELHKNKEIK